MGYNLRSLIALISAFAAFCGALVSGSLFWFVLAISAVVIVLICLIGRTVQGSAHFAAFHTVFVAISVVGMVLTATARLPFTGWQLWRGLHWAFGADADSWFAYNGTVQIACVYVANTFVLAVLTGLIVQSGYGLLRRHGRKSR